MIPWLTAMPWKSSGEVSIRTRITGSPRSTHATASSASNTARPTAAPGEAFSPLTILVAPMSAFGSKVARRSWSTCAGSIRSTASRLVITPSLTIWTAIFTAAAAVRLAMRVWSMYRRPRSIVNSRSWTSR